MPREPWRDDPVYLGLWRSARQQAEGTSLRLVLADWLEEHGHTEEAWRERLHGLMGDAPVFEPDTGLARVGLVPMGEEVWRGLRAAPPPGNLVCEFKRDVQAYRYLKQYPGRCGWNLGMSHWSSVTERSHLLAVPRLEMLACNLVDPADWDWIMDHLPGLTHFEADGPMVDVGRLRDLTRLTRLRGLLLRGSIAYFALAAGCLPGLRHLSVGPYHFEAEQLAQLAPELESLQADVVHFGKTIHWPRLRSLQMVNEPGPLMGSQEVRALARYPFLERLSLRCGKVTEAALKALANLPRLRALTLRFLDGNAPSLKALAAAPALESLTIEGGLNENRLLEITNIAGLRELSLTYETIGQVFFARLASLHQLETVRLEGTCEGFIPRPVLAELGRLPHLAKLDLERLTMSAKTFTAMQEACPPWVECCVPLTQRE